MSPEAILSTARTRLASKLPNDFKFNNNACLGQIRALQVSRNSDESLLLAFLEEVSRHPELYLQEPPAGATAGADLMRSSAPQNVNNSSMSISSSAPENVDGDVANIARRSWQPEPEVFRYSPVAPQLYVRKEAPPAKKEQGVGGFLRRLFRRNRA